MLMLSHHFYNERLQHGLHGVYPKFSEYCDVLCLLFGSMSHAAVAAAIQAYPGIIADQLINWLWPSISEMFEPWLVPYYPQNMKDAPAAWIQQFAATSLQPWSEVHSESAGKIIRVFAMCLQYNLDMLPASNLLLGNLFSWYDAYFAHKTTPKHVLVPIQTLLMKMPFERFRPAHIHMEGMNRILMDFVPDCHLFIGNIFLRIPWTTWLQQTMSSWDFSTAQRILAILLMTFAKLSYEPKVRESIRILQLLQEAQNYPWHLLEYKDLESVLDWFVMSAEPSVILKIPSEHETIDCNLLVLLQIASCMQEFQPKDIQGIQPSVLIAKRMAYVRSIVRLLRGCDAKLHQLMSTKQGKDLFNDACGGLLNLIDTCFLNADETNNAEVINLVVTILQGMTLPESTGALFCDAIKFWQSTSQTGKVILCSFLNALRVEKKWTLHTLKVLESSLLNYMRVSGE
jgi:ectopic P granules protein 5